MRAEQVNDPVGADIADDLHAAPVSAALAQKGRGDRLVGVTAVAIAASFVWWHKVCG